MESKKQGAGQRVIANWGWAKPLWASEPEFQRRYSDDPVGSSNLWLRLRRADTGAHF